MYAEAVRGDWVGKLNGEPVDEPTEIEGAKTMMRWILNTSTQYIGSCMIADDCLFKYGVAEPGKHYNKSRNLNAL